MSIVSVAEARDIVGVADTDTLVPILHPFVEKTIEEKVGWEVERDTYTRYYPPHDRGAVPEYFPGDFGIVPMAGGRSQVIRLHHKFVLLAGLKVWEAPAAYFGQATEFTDASHLLTEGSHYCLDTEDGVVSEGGHLRRLGAYWPRQPGSVKVTYTAGFTADELNGSGGNVNASDLRYAELAQFQKAYAEGKTWQTDAATGGFGPKQSESVPGYSYVNATNVAARLTGQSMVLTPQVEALIHRFRRYDL
jgi:hypothetical protein